MTKTVELSTLSDFNKYASEFSHTLKPGDVVAMRGDLGAGKTTFVQSAARELGVKQVVQSPTFTMVNVYQGGFGPIHHIDLYRIHHADELLELDLDGYFDEPAVSFVEWADRFPETLPEAAKWIQIVRLADGKRRIDVT